MLISQTIIQQKMLWVLGDLILYLWVWEFQASDREHHFSCSDEEILRDLKGYVHSIGMNIFHCHYRATTLHTDQICTSQSAQIW